MIETLDLVQLIDNEGYPKSEYSQYTVIHLTIKNVSDAAVETEEAIYGTDFIM